MIIIIIIVVVAVTVIITLISSISDKKGETKPIVNKHGESIPMQLCL